MDVADAPDLLAKVRHWLDVATLGMDARLPPERELAAQFRVTRAELRKALAVLHDEGHIQRQIGRGTFLAPKAGEARRNGKAVADRTSPLAAMQARVMIEPELARLAALNATSVQIADMRKLCEEMRRTPAWNAYAELDWRFHNMIAEATGNTLLVEIQSLLNGVRRFVVWGNLVVRADGPSPDYHSFDEHQAIVDAIATRDPERAMRTMLDHLGSTRSHLIGDRHGRSLPAR